MKKLISLLLLVSLMVLGLVACGKKSNEQVELVPPDNYWCNHFQTFFEGDTFVEVEPYDGYEFNVKVSDEDKYCALFKCFNGGDWKYGSARIKINFEYVGGQQPNTSLGAMYESDIKALFKGNKYYVTDFIDDSPYKIHHIILKPVCIKTYVDNIGSYNGCNCHSAEDQARNIVFAGCKLGVVFNSAEEE